MATPGVRTKTRVQELAKEFVTNGAFSQGFGGSSSQQPIPRGRQPQWTPDEPARPSHVIFNPRHFTVLAALHRKPESTAGLDKERNYPWTADFFDTFNDESFLHDRPPPVVGVSLATIEIFNPCVHIHERRPEAL